MELSSLLIFHSVVFIIGTILGVRVFKKNRDIEFKNAHNYSKIINFIGTILVIIIITLLTTLKIDELSEKLPYIIQRNTILYIWLSLGMFLTVFSGYSIFLAIKLLKKLRLIQFVSSIIVLNTLFLYLNFDYNKEIHKTIAPINFSSTLTMQTTLYSCSCATLSTILKYYGLKLNEKDIAKLMGTTKFGSTKGQLRYAINKLNFKYETLNKKYKELSDLKSPTILFIDRRDGVENHATAYFGKVGEKYKLLDPMDGVVILTKKEIDQIWHGNGIRIYK